MLYKYAATSDFLKDEQSGLLGLPQGVCGRWITSHECPFQNQLDFPNLHQLIQPLPIPLRFTHCVELSAHCEHPFGSWLHAIDDLGHALPWNMTGQPNASTDYKVVVLFVLFKRIVPHAQVQVVLVAVSTGSLK